VKPGISTHSKNELNETISVLHPSVSGLWVGLSVFTDLEEGGLWRFDGAIAQRVFPTEGLTQFQHHTNAIDVDEKGVIWAGTKGGALGLAGNEWRFFTKEDGLPADDVTAVGHDDAGRIYFGTNGGGLAIYEDGAFRVLTTGDGLANDHIRAMHKDLHGDLWIGTQGGVSHYDGSMFVSYRRRDGLPHSSVMDIVTGSKRRLWMATPGGGLAVFDGTTFSAVDTRDGFPKRKIRGRQFKPRFPITHPLWLLKQRRAHLPRWQIRRLSKHETEAEGQSTGRWSIRQRFFCFLMAL